jgi:hypothetical protein
VWVDLSLRLNIGGLNVKAPSVLPLDMSKKRYQIGIIHFSSLLPFSFSLPIALCP